MAVASVSKHQEAIIGTLQAQLHEGKVGPKPRVAPYYSKTTYEQYAQDPATAPRDSIYGSNDKEGPYTFEWFGEFFESMTIKAEEEDFSIDSNAGTLDDLLELDKMKKKNFTKEEVLTLSEDNETDLVEKLIEPDIYEGILNRLAKIII